MHLDDARALARTLMDRHGLRAWSFGFDRGRRRLGACWPAKRRITLSRAFVEANDEPVVREVALHEIAHALTPGAGHGPAWRDACRRLGVPPRRLVDASRVTAPPPRGRLRCRACGLETPRYRRPSRPLACRRCCERENGGRPDARFRLEWLPGPAPDRAGVVDPPPSPPSPPSPRGDEGGEGGDGGARGSSRAPPRGRDGSR